MPTRPQAMRRLAETSILLSFPGEICSHGGTYKCFLCDETIRLHRGERFPPADHHRHSHIVTDTIRWALFEGEPNDAGMGPPG